MRTFLLKTLACAVVGMGLGLLTHPGLLATVWGVALAVSGGFLFLWLSRG